jgi:hypothetical protein
LYRTSEIAVGALVAFIVSALVMPKRSDDRALDHASTIAKLLSCLIGPALVPREGSDAFTDGVKEKLRAELRQLMVLTHHSRWKRQAENAVSKLTRLLSAINADIGFIERTVGRPPVQDEAAAFALPLGEIANAFEGLLSQAANAFVGKASAPRTDALDRALGALENPVSPAEGAPSPPSPQHLIFLVRTLREDCRKLCSLAAAAQRVA